MIDDEDPANHSPENEENEEKEENEELKEVQDQEDQEDLLESANVKFDEVRICSMCLATVVYCSLISTVLCHRDLQPCCCPDWIGLVLDPRFFRTWRRPKDNWMKQRLVAY